MCFELEVCLLSLKVRESIALLKIHLLISHSKAVLLLLLPRPHIHYSFIIISNEISTLLARNFMCISEYRARK